MATMFDIDNFMSSLAGRRPIFHSEADFQHAFAWHFHELFPNAVVRLEYPVHIGKWIYLDLWLDTPETSFGVELKYKALKLEISHDDEHFYLKNHSAQDTGRYDFLKDVERLEQVAATKNKLVGYAILVTNDSSYWRVGREGTVDSNFRLHPGRIITGELNWDPNASIGTTKGRTEAIYLSREHVVEWKSFSKLAVKTKGEFCYLAFKV